ncbi:MAG: class II aldolase/adducin family protein [Blastochloris sp.]|jgi:rhamnose utilization protein RhaD (predicted bifunctional aldolase and dehydrogenase)|nr:class II aldolase/adducin family protein [Blastochloris sp.]
MSELLDRLVTLSHELGREERKLAILGEGNTSADIGDGTFWIKGSGSSLGTMQPQQFSRVKRQEVLDFVDRDATEQEVQDFLQASRVDVSQPHPSVETFLHALCMELGGAKFVGHTHTESMLSILASKAGAEPFLRHIYPDVIVVCGRHVAVVPYVDPGLELAQAVRAELIRYQEKHGKGPKLLLMVNHGPVALGQTEKEVLNILLMADKWARALNQTHAWGGPNYMSEVDSDRIDSRLDEHFRRKQILAANK